MCKSKQTFTQLHDLGYNYKEWYIKVKWCLYPHIPIFNKTTYTYVKMVNKRGKNLKIFKIAQHENCMCNQPDKSPTGGDQYEAMRKAYIETLNVTDEGNFVNLPTQFNILFISYTHNYVLYSICLSYRLENKCNFLFRVRLFQPILNIPCRHYLLHQWKTAFSNQG